MIKLKKITSVMLAAFSLSTLHISKVNAAWIKDSNGWWNTEGNSWSVGWRLIENEWYYFDSQGYMKTGWILDGEKWYYLNTNGTMAKNTTIDGYKIGADGAWINNEEENTFLNNTDDKLVTDNNNGVTKDLTMEELINSLKDKGYNPQVRDAEKGFLAGTRKIINIGDEKLEVYIYDSNDNMEKDAKSIYRGGFSYKNSAETSIKLSWDSYPHFYKNKNIIVLYVGKTEKTINDLNNILGPKFLGIEYRDSLKNVDDARKIACKYLSTEYPEIKNLEDMWKSCAILDSSQTSAVKDNEYAIIFEREAGDKIGVTIDNNTFEELSSLSID